MKTKLVELLFRAASKALTFAYVHLGANSLDRQIFREMRKLLKRRLTLAEKETVIFYRTVHEHAVRSGNEAYKAYRAEVDKR